MKFWLFIRLLRWYAEEELDQWDMWRTKTKYGPVYIQITREPTPGTNPNHYEEF